MQGTESPRAVEAEVRALLGDTRVSPAGAEHAVGGVSPRLIVAPASEQEVAAVLCAADAHGLAVVPRGGGTKLGWGNPPARADLVLSLARLDRIVEHAWADQTVTVEAGCTIARVQEHLARQGQRLAIDVLWPERATVGGILATNDSGVLRLRYGGLRDLAIGVTLALADGTLAASGGKVVKNVAGYDLPKLVTGALGTLGVITRATFRLHPLPRATRSLTAHPESVRAMQRLVAALQGSNLAHAALQVRLAGQATPEVDVLLEGTEAGIDAQEAQVRALAGAVKVTLAQPDVWNARQALWADVAPSIILRLSALPATLDRCVEVISSIVPAHGASWRAVLQATGLGQVRIDPGGGGDAAAALVQGLRTHLAERGGSLVVLQQPPWPQPIEAWGSVGDALPLMRAVKHQLDPRGTLNPGRFVGGI